MITDGLLVLPALLISYVLEFLEIETAFPDFVHELAATTGSFIAVFDFILPMYLVSDMLYWLFLIWISYTVIWAIFIFSTIRNIFKIF